MDNIIKILQYAVTVNASDVFITAGKPPHIKINGVLDVVSGWESAVITDSEVRSFIDQARPARMTEAPIEDSDFAVKSSLVAGKRFRANSYLTQGMPGVVLRPLSEVIPELSSLGLPHQFTELATKKSGLLLVTGATGSGKSTTLASILMDICNRPKKHIITIEDPIEYALSSPLTNIITQREVGSDTESFARALRSALREAPDVIMVGEIRDRETALLAMEAAETGHLVISTLHTASPVGSIHRLMNLFPADDKGNVSSRLAETLLGVVSQTLLPRADGNGRVLAYETLVATHAVRGNLLQGQVDRISQVMQGGASEGMDTIDRCLKKLLSSGAIDSETHQATLTKYQRAQRQ